MRTKSHARRATRSFRPRIELLEDRVTPAILPAGFQESIVAAGINGATAMEIAPDGRIWVLEQGGDVEVFHAGSTTGFTALDIPAGSINSVGERGLLGIAFDPSYNIGDAAPDFVYLYYTSTAAPSPHNRISRFTVNNTIPDQPTLGSEQVILELNALIATTHNGGAIHFGPDGKLYAAVGDNSNGANAQSLSTLHGKMLRINSDGTIPIDNPFINQTTGKNQAIWARGLRNPFTFTFQLGTGRMHINDVGENTWEEINVGAAGANYGWPTTEGPFNQSLFPTFTQPFYSYLHGTGTFQGFAITGGAFYNPSSPGINSFPPPFEGDYFFADFINDWINVIDISTGAVSRFATAAPGAVDLRVTPDGNLLYLARDTGRVHRVIFTAVITVNTTVDEDNGIGVGGVSLREAIKAANLTAAPDIINFNIPGAGPHTLAVTSPLPALTTRMTINGNTQPGIILNGSGAGAGAHGLVLRAPGSFVRGLTINNFQGNGILVFGAGCVVQGCRIGTNVDGTIAAPNQLHGIMIAGTANGVRIGGTTAGAGNLISGNGLAGVALHGPFVKNNFVQGNRIGTDELGSAALGNGYVGVLISGGAATNTIGGILSAARNIISGNGDAGVEISGVGTTGNVVIGNYIGLDITGASQIGNAGDGVVIKEGAAGNRVGGAAPSRNVISGNVNGVNVFDVGTTGNLISGNYIGTNSSGTGALGNTLAGVRIATLAAGNTVGGTMTGTGNVISGNGTGIVISGAGANRVQGNFIGVNAAGTSALANGGDGVTLSLGAKNNVIGGTLAGSRNIISGNGASGVLLSGLDTTGNLIQGNFIGTDITGNLDLGNVEHGVRIVLGAMNNIIGGDVAGARNIISGNNGNGVGIESSSNNRVQGNFIGTNAAGAASLPNTNGVNLLSAASNTIGGITPGARNLISGNTSNGVAMSGVGATANLVQGNFIGTNAAGTGDLGNGSSGVAILGDAAANTIGGNVAAVRNIISGNDQSGVQIAGTGAVLNLVQGNFIGLAVNGISPLGNTQNGVFITSNAANNRIGGTAAGAGNTIAHNGGDGVLIGSDPANGFNDPAGVGNSVLGNRIFANAGQGIDLGANDGPTPNDTDDVDTGPNSLLNKPVLTSAFIDGSNLFITGFLNTVLGTTWRIEFFSSPATGTNQTFLGAISGAMGSTRANFATTIVVPTSVVAGHKLTATLTDQFGNTSEFSIPLTIE